MPNKNYVKGYSLERYAQLILEFNGYHVKRNAMSIGIEDIIAFNGVSILLVQCKNTIRGKGAMTKEEMELLRRHARDSGGGAIPVYLYKEKFGKYVWLDVDTNVTMIFPMFTKEWYKKRNTIRKNLRLLKRESPTTYTVYVLNHWNDVKDFIC